jgi:hypothetical protein
MGSIMCLGVSVSNSVMLVTFIDEHWKRGMPSVEAAILGASERLRPILMTACAMTVGMVPMALALEKGSQMQAPLGRAVIGGLVMSTFATLLVLPSIFAVVIGKTVAHSPSIYPDDPESACYDPKVFAQEGRSAHRGTSDHDGESGEPETVMDREERDVLIFLRQILDEARSKRHDVVKHYTVDDLRVALGFKKPGTDGDSTDGVGEHASTHPRHPRTGPAGDRSSLPGTAADLPPDAPHSNGGS